MNLQLGKCPKCGGSLTNKTNQSSGEYFIGCSNYATKHHCCYTRMCTIEEVQLIESMPSIGNCVGFKRDCFYYGELDHGFCPDCFELFKAE